MGETVHVHYVILGNGVAGMEAALALRSRDEEARITLVSAEHDHFFSRPALMYVFAGQTSLRDTEPYDRGLYERLRFERVSRRVASLDAAGHALVFDDGSRLGYGRLLLAVGSQARRAPWPGAEGPGLHSFVTLRDLEALDREAKKGMKAAVLGGGLIGVEVAEVLHDRGLHVTFVIREGWYFPVALDRNEATLVAEHLRECGLDVRLGTGVEAVQRGADGRVRAVRLAGGDEIAADLVIATIGVVPNTSFLAASGLKVASNGALETDDALRTSAEDVWAAGDCANVTWYDGSRRPEQLWYTARDQGRLAARSMLGDEVAYRRGAWYNSAKFFDMEYTTAGRVPVSIGPDGSAVAPPAGLRTWFQRVPGRFESQRIVVEGDRVVGFNMLGSRWNHEPFLQWIHERRPLDWVLKHLGEAQFDEELSPRFRLGY
ncbi:MAG TPA: NAD(P)/FAD-dependent oxidoreductase [Vicinamibacteria bacterium]|nr:NAD(P)/FAD-dependent oxidoreductase [Vicinamibacteria bacterium]